MPTAIYVRESLDRTGEGAAVDRQLKEAEEVARSRNLDVIARFNDNNRSATTGVKRPDFEKLLKMIQRKEVDTVLVWHPDRLYRKLRDLVPLMELAATTPLTLVSVTFSDLNLSTASGRMVATQMASVGTYEGEHKSERQLSAYPDYANAGIWHFSHRPFGYTRDRGRNMPVTIVPKEAAVVREMFARYYDGESHHALVKDLNARQILTARGNPWSITQLREVLNNPHYAGFNTYKGRLIEEHNWEPIITREQWQKYTGAASKRKVVSTFSRTATSLLSGIIRCDVCGAKCYRKQRSGAGKTVYEYSCSNGSHVSGTTPAIDAYVRKEILAALLFGPRGVIPVDDDGADMETLSEGIEELRHRADDLVALVGDGFSTSAKVRPQLESIKADIDSLTERREDIMQASAAAEVLLGIKADLFKGARVSFEEATEVKAQIAKRYDALTLKRKRELASLLLDIRMGKGRGTSRILVTHKIVQSLNEEAA